MTDTPENYRQTLLTVLRGHSDSALSALRAVDRHLPPQTRGMQIMVHLPQDEEGLFTVMVHLEGPDAAALNSAVGTYRTLFDVRFVDGKVVPDVPLFDPFDLPFSVNDAIVDSVAIWMKEVWAAFRGLGRGLPVRVVSPDGYGSLPPLSLAP